MIISFVFLRTRYKVSQVPIPYHDLTLPHIIVHPVCVCFRNTVSESLTRCTRARVRYTSFLC
jgi:hypothetical protein